MRDLLLAGRYRLLSELGVGGMSSVWKATDLRLEVPVAVKLLNPTIAQDEKSLARFLREAKTCAQLKSRHIVQSLDCGVDAGTPYLVMELLNGGTLRDRLRDQGKLTPAETAAILSKVAHAMQLAHAAGIVHRDLKPDNIFLAVEDNEIVVKVLDFGVAKRPTNVSGSSTALTEPGAIFGTPNYMSPEQIDARCSVDHRTDIWAFAVIAFECLTGLLPFREETLREQFVAICGRPLPKPSQLGPVPPAFDEWFAKACCQDVQFRFPTIEEASIALCHCCGSTGSLGTSSLTAMVYSASSAISPGTGPAVENRTSIVGHSDGAQSLPAPQRGVLAEAATPPPTAAAKPAPLPSHRRGRVLLAVGVALAAVGVAAARSLFGPAQVSTQPDSDWASRSAIREGNVPSHVEVSPALAEQPTTGAPSVAPATDAQLHQEPQLPGVTDHSTAPGRKQTEAAAVPLVSGTREQTAPPAAPKVAVQSSVAPQKKRANTSKIADGASTPETAASTSPPRRPKISLGL